MIPILFAPDATSFSTNGIGRLSDALTCVVHEARNGEFELEMSYPVTGAHFADIVHSSIIVAKPSARRSLQAFRVYQITKPLNGKITVKAQHISYQLSFIPVSPFTATNLTNAMQYLKSMAAEACPFTFTADFTSDSDFAIPLPSSIRSYLGGRQGSILDIYGGEWEFDNYAVKLHRARGENNGYVIRYGKNLTDLKQEESILNTYTGIYPYWQSEEDMQTLTQKVVHAPTAANFPFQRTLVMDFSQAFNGKPTEAALLAYTQRYITNNNIGIPAVNLQIDFVNLPDTEEYKGLIAGAKNLDLCDTVTIKFEKLNISETSKVIEIWWDVLRDRYQKIEVGNKRSSLSTTIEEQMEKIDLAVTPEQMAQTIDRATGVLNAGTRGHVILNRNSGGWANELLALDNDNIAAAQKVLRINMNGIGFSSSGYQGPYAQAWTMDGTLSLGGVNNAYGNLVILDSNGMVIGRWNKDGIYANGGELRIGSNFYVDQNGNLRANNGTFVGGTINIGNKFRVDSNGNLYATDGSFTGNINSGSVITGAKILASEIGTTDDEFYVVENEEQGVEIGFSGFDCWDKILRTNWIGSVENPATDGDDAGINGRTGDAGFRKLYLLDGWYEGDDGMWDVTRTIRWIDNRLRSIESFCASHDWSGSEGGDDGDDPGSGGDDGYLPDGPVENDSGSSQPSDPISFDGPS